MPNSSIIVKGKTIVGPEIVVDNLLVYYDISNEKSYAGTGITVDTLTAYPAPNADLFGRAQYISTFPQSIEFQAPLSEYLRYNLTNFGLSFTVMSVVASLTPTWTDYGSLGGGFIFNGLGAPVNGFDIQADPTNTSSPAYFGRRVTFNVEYTPTPVNNPNNYYLGDKVLADITKPNLYYLSWNQSTGAVVFGANNDITSYTISPLPGRTPNNLPVIIGKGAQDYTSIRYMNMKFYAHMLYDRALTRNEILLNYQSLKPRFNL